MAGIKKTWKEFGLWIAKKYNLENLMLEKVEVDVKIYMPSRRRADLDNFGSGTKTIFDPLVEAHFLIDDDYKHLCKLTITGGYDKEHPRTELIFKTIGD